MEYFECIERYLPVTERLLLSLEAEFPKLTTSTSRVSKAPYGSNARICSRCMIWVRDRPEEAKNNRAPPPNRGACPFWIRNRVWQASRLCRNDYTYKIYSITYAVTEMVLGATRDQGHFIQGRKRFTWILLSDSCTKHSNITSFLISTNLIPQNGHSGMTEPNRLTTVSLVDTERATRLENNAIHHQNSHKTSSYTPPSRPFPSLPPVRSFRKSPVASKITLFLP